MLVLGALNRLLAHFVGASSNRREKDRSNTVHTAVLFTPAGALVAYASAPPALTKDAVRILVGLAWGTWAESRAITGDMVECELGRIFVLPILSPAGVEAASAKKAAQTNGHNEQHKQDNEQTDKPKDEETPTPDPVMLLALNASEIVEWGELQVKAQYLARHLAKPLAELQNLAPPPRTTKNPRLNIARSV